jgi:hypothetical protein
MSYGIKLTNGNDVTVIDGDFPMYVLVDKFSWSDADGQNPEPGLLKGKVRISNMDAPPLVFVRHQTLDTRYTTMPPRIEYDSVNKEAILYFPDFKYYQKKENYSGHYFSEGSTPLFVYIFGRTTTYPANDVPIFSYGLKVTTESGEVSHLSGGDGTSMGAPLSVKEFNPLNTNHPTSNISYGPRSIPLITSPTKAAICVLHDPETQQRLAKMTNSFAGYTNERGAAYWSHKSAWVRSTGELTSFPAKSEAGALGENGSLIDLQVNSTAPKSILVIDTDDYA